ncbi:MAG: Release factor glutamine methyltransferase [Bacteroidetes bacterium ADurb.BinA261]|jgi:release factor glutamine methyltransferase|nr:MAG: Release factor glutamine methyltransferase [Bacteroidetes bacterium ADurb.BinA261]
MQDPSAYILSQLSGIYPKSEINYLIRIILHKVCGLSTTDIALRKFNDLSDTQFANIIEIVSRLRNHEPIQYILGKAEFYNLQLQVNPAVLIPRPETEELIDWILSEKKSFRYILDIGTGSGCIAIALAKNISKSEVDAWDISLAALKTANVNAKNNNVRINFNQVDILNDEMEYKTYDLIVSNPPYIAESEKQAIEPNVLDFEPHLALFVPDSDPLIFYRKIADLAIKLLIPGGELFFEINRAKGSDIVSLLTQKGFTGVQLRKDLSGNERMIKAVKR